MTVRPVMSTPVQTRATGLLVMLCAAVVALPQLVPTPAEAQQAGGGTSPAPGAS